MRLTTNNVLTKISHMMVVPISLGYCLNRSLVFQYLRYLLRKIPIKPTGGESGVLFCPRPFLVTYL